jgi:hypothetical protein
MADIKYLFLADNTPVPMLSAQEGRAVVDRTVGYTPVPRQVGD